MTQQKGKIDRHKKLVEELKKKQKQADELDKKFNFLSKEEKRKRRTRRLIQTGALAEIYFQTSELSHEEVEELFKMFSDYVNHNKPKKFKK